MRIGINTRFLLSDKMEGFGWYTFEVTKRIVLAHPEVEFFFFFDRKFDPKFIFADNVKGVVIPPPARHPILFKIWFDYGITRALKKHHIDLFFSPDGYLSLRTKVKQIGVIHDLNFEHFPEDLPKSASKYLRKNFPLFAQKADKIVTVSSFSKEDIISQYKIESDKITVAYNGINTAFVPKDAVEKELVKQQFTRGQEYALFVGSIHPRKNLKRLLLAFEQYKTASKSKLVLLIVGDRYWWNDELKQCYDNLVHKNEIIFTGHLNQEDLIAVSASAKFLAYVSYFEGFGLPVSEAMQVGTPVLASKETAIPEVGGEAVHYVDPFSIDSICLGIKKLDEDPEYCKQLIQKGFEQCKKFNWDNTAKIVWDTIEATLD